MRIVKKRGFIGFFLSFFIIYLTAEEVKIDKELNSFVVDVMGKPFKVERVQNPQHRLSNSYTKTSRPCPPFCIQPFEPVKGVKTIGEVELVKFMQTDMSNNKGILVDARMPKWFVTGTIPGAVNIPFSIFSKRNGGIYIDKILPLLGAEKINGKWNFKNAQKMVIFDNGPWCQQAFFAISNLVKLGYPKDKIEYYRGGMQYWQILGFSTFKPKE
jgi:rhodanese-related sulfurtransferase